MKKNKFTVLKTLVFLTALCASTFLNNAFALSPQEISLPENLGFIIQTHASIDTSHKKLILHIQDLHVHYEAQKNLAQILEKFVKDYKLDLILVEGGWGDVSLSYLRDYGSKEKRLEVAEKYLKSGEISGEEYLDIISDYPLKLYGIEEEDLYNRHIRLFLEVEKFQEPARAYIQGLKEIAEKLKTQIYSRDLKEFDQIQSEKEADKITLVTFCQVLADKAKATNLDINAWPDVHNFVELSRLEKSVDFKKADEERKYLLSQLQPALSEDELKLTSDALLKDGKLKPIDYYSTLENLAKEKLPDFTKSIWSERTYANFNAYLKYLRVSEGIDLGELSAQIETLCLSIKEKLFRSEEEKKLSEISDGLKILENLVMLKLSPEEYHTYQTQQLKNALKGYTLFLKEKQAQYNIVLSGSTDYSISDDNFKMLDDFYKVAEERNSVFMDKIVSHMQDFNADVACVITGGFHTPFLIDALKKQDIAYCVIAPRITQPADDAQYVKILKEKAGIK